MLAALQRITPDLLNKVEDFQKKCASGKVEQSDAKAFLAAIQQSGQTSSDTSTHKASTTTDPVITTRVAKALTDLLATLNQQKNALKAIIPYTEVTKAVNDLHAYAKAESEKAKSVGRKDAAGLERGL